MELNPSLVEGARLYYSCPENVVRFINHWFDTYDPRNTGSGRPVRMPLVMFGRQEEFVRFVMACLEADVSGLVEKSRDMGATWLAIAISVWLWLFHTSVSIGWYSNLMDNTDTLGDTNTIFEKIRQSIQLLPEFFCPPTVRGTHLKQGICWHPSNGSVIRGYGGDNPGRSGRSRIFFVDEAAHLEHPEMVDLALSENTRCRVDISSVSGLGTVFQRARESGQEWAPGQEVVRDRTNVFIMDWRDHPEKTREWYEEKRAYWTSRGMPQVVAREIDRDYAASSESVVIPYEWLEACVDADKTLGFDDSGGRIAGLDIADGGIDLNALVKRSGSVLYHAEEWGERDVGETARRAVSTCRRDLPIEIQYDSSPIGSGVKSELNRLETEGILPEGMTFAPWNAAARVLNPSGRILPDDKNSPTNRDFYSNLKAQAWWELRMRAHCTYQCVREGAEYEPDQLLSLDSARLGAVLPKLMKELAQATSSQDGRLKLTINKAPAGTRSPNLADATVMAFWPWRRSGRHHQLFFAPRLIPGSG
jgi:hypothetical protein